MPFGIQIGIKLFRKETTDHENDLPAQEEAENGGARIQKENVHKERKKRSQEKKTERQKETFRLICHA